jgi:hypothetical protein
MPLQRHRLAARISHAGGTTSASSVSVPATLISSAPPRLCASQGTLRYFNSTREGRPPCRPKALASSENMENWTAYSAPQQADPIPIYCKDAVPGVRIRPCQLKISAVLRENPA